MANLLTAIRLLLAMPVALSITDPGLGPSWLLLALIILAISSDFFDGKIARALKTTSAKGMLFDHGTDFVLVTAALFALSTTGLSSILLPLLIVVAFSQYVLDSYFLFKQKQLRMSFLGRWNGILYFVPLLLFAAARVSLFADYQSLLQTAIMLISYGLIASTIASIFDRAIAPLRANKN